MFDPFQVLLGNAALQITFSTVLGWAMLIPRQPWGARWKPLLSRDFTAAHLDWLMLAFMQAVAALVLREHPAVHAPLFAALLVLGGWLNPVPYVFRAFGINAFSLSGGWKQFTSAALSGVSSLALTVAWLGVLIEW
jgi:hypothetical protein